MKNSLKLRNQHVKHVEASNIAERKLINIFFGNYLNSLEINCQSTIFIK